MAHLSPVLLIEWGSADWQTLRPMLGRGELPHLSRLLADGVKGELSPCYPAVPEMLWNTAVTGQFADRHGVFGQWDADDATETVRSAVRRVPAVWEILTGRGEPVCLVGDGEPFDDALTMQPGEIAPEILRLFVPRAAVIDQRTDNRLAVLAHVLAESFTAHNRATLAAAGNTAALAVLRYPLLSALDEALPGSENDPFFGEIIPGAYRLLDLFLGRLRQLTGESAPIFLFSAAGRRNEYGTFAPGILALSGEGLRAGETIYGATLLNIAPTLLTLLGQPVSDDMPGRVWSDAWRTPPRVNRCPPAAYIPQTGEPASAPAPPFHAVRRNNRWRLAETLFETRRYGEAVRLLTGLHRESRERPVLLLLAQSLLHSGANAAAEALLTPLVLAENPPFARYLLGVAVLAQKRTAEGWELLHGAERTGAQEPPAFFVRLGYAYFQSRRIDLARRAFEAVIARDPDNTGGHLGLAGCAILRRDLPRAVAHAERTVALRYDSPYAHLILGRVYEWQEKLPEAVRAYETALRFQPDWRFVERSLRLLRKRRKADPANGQADTAS